MIAIAIQIPQFPANVRSDTYAVNYGRVLGAEWMRRSSERNAPAEQPFYAEVAERVTGAADGLNDADGVTVELIASYVRSRPALNTMDRVGLTALAELSKTDPDLARSLVAELPM